MNIKISNYFRKLYIENIQHNKYVIILLVISGLFSILLFWLIIPIGVDWEYTFSHLAKIWRNPYQLSLFTNPPWILFLLPHSLLPLRLGNAINLFLNMIIIIITIRLAGGGRKAIILTFTCPFFFDLARTNNIDWIPLLGFILGPLWGFPLLAVKPQALGGAGLVWAFDAIRRREWKVFLPFAIIVLLSFAWGFWPSRLNLPNNVMWNFSPFPYSLPLGIYLLYHALKENDAYLGAASTPFLVPYIAPYSVAGLFGITSSRWPRVAQVIWVALWIYVIVSMRRSGLFNN
jgi:hypothetical protein